MWPLSKAVASAERIDKKGRLRGAAPSSFYLPLLFARKGEVRGDRLVRADRDLLILRSQLLVPRLEGVLARRQVLDREGAVVAAGGEEGVRQHADIGGHPRMNVALHVDHFLLVEGLVEGRQALGLCLVELG